MIVERLDLLVQSDVGRFEAHPASLRCIEAGGGDGDAFDGHVAEKFGQRRIRIDEIGLRKQIAPTRMFHESLFDLQVANLVAPLVVIQQAVEADRSAGEDELPHFDVGLNGARSTQTDQRELPLLRLLLPRGEIHVGQRIELRNRNVDVADADTGRKHGHPLAFVGTRHGIEFAVGNAALLRIEKGSDHGYAAGIPHEDDDVGKLLRLEVQVENRSVVVDYQFGRRYGSHSVGFYIFIIGIKVLHLPRISKNTPR